MLKNPLKFQPSEIQFGTDGWRGVLGVDFTIERLLLVAMASAEELAYRFPDAINQKLIVGYDRRFMAEEFAVSIASVLKSCKFEPLIAETSVTTPACGWAVIQLKALGALVVTASHNPPQWLGLKIKDSLGRAVDDDFTKAVEHRLDSGVIRIPIKDTFDRFKCREMHLKGVAKKFDLNKISSQFHDMGLRVIVDSMHGSAAGCLKELFNDLPNLSIKEIRMNRDVLFGGNPPEPLEKNVQELIERVKNEKTFGRNAIGIIFDGDGDRIAAIDENGRFCTTQLLIPLFIEYMAANNYGCVLKTVSGSDLMQLISEDLGREVFELPVGFKFIAERMVSKDVLLGGEESGGIGFGNHFPERDALYSAMILLSAIGDGGKLLSQRLDSIQSKYGESFFDRIDIRLVDNKSREELEESMKLNLPSKVANQIVKEIITIDGLKLRIGKMNWVMFRFSGTEPLLRLYCEAPTKKQLEINLQWCKEFVDSL